MTTFNNTYMNLFNGEADLAKATWSKVLADVAKEVNGAFYQTKKCQAGTPEYWKAVEAYRLAKEREEGILAIIKQI